MRNEQERPIIFYVHLVKTIIARLTSLGLNSPGTHIAHIEYFHLNNYES